MAREVDEIFYEIRLQLSKKCGTEGIRVLGRAFLVNDRNNDGTVDFHTFQSVLGKAGVFLPRVDSSRLYRFHDPHREEHVHYSQFLSNLIGEINERRLNLVKLVFSTISGGASSIALPDLMRAFNAEGHSKVQTGEFDARQIFDEFFSCLPAAQPDAESEQVTMEDFVSYYTDLSAVLVHSDDAFASMMAAVWGVQEPLAASRTAVAAQDREVAHVRQLVADKVLQRSKAGAAETDTLRKRFKTYDLDDDGMLDQADFFEALTTLGVSLPPKQQKVFFSRVAPNGLLDYTAFAHSLFAAEDGLIPARAPAAARQTRSGTSTATTDLPPVAALTAADLAEATAPVTAPPANNDFPAVLFLIGAPGSGKTTQAAALSQRMGFAHVSVELLLAGAHDNPQHRLHGLVRASSARGDRVPVEAVVTLIKDEMSLLYSQGLRNFVIDGFPKSIEHLRAWNDIMASYCRPPCFVFLRTDVSAAEARATPVPSAVRDAKADTYRRDTAPLCDALLAQGKLVVVDADAPQDDVTETMLDIIASA